MAISTLVSRFGAYYRRRGFAATSRRAGLALRRTLFLNRMVLFYCDLSGQASRPADLPKSLKVERKRSNPEIIPQDFDQIVNVWNPKLARRNIEERFAQGASLWLITLEDSLAGYGWTLQGRTIEPHYFPLGEDDVHLFDFYVFPQYRGRGLNPLLVAGILRSLANDCGGRAFIEAAEWNQAQLSSLARTPFRRLGWARKMTLFGRTIVWWGEDATMRQAEENSHSTRPAVPTDRNLFNVPR